MFGLFQTKRVRKLPGKPVKMSQFRPKFIVFVNSYSESGGQNLCLGYFRLEGLEKCHGSC